MCLLHDKMYYEIVSVQSIMSLRILHTYMNKYAGRYKHPIQQIADTDRSAF